MIEINQKKLNALLKQYENNYLFLSEQEDKELIIQIINENIEKFKNKNIIQQFIISQYFAIIFTGKLKPIIDKPSKGKEMNDKMIEYLENMKREILTHVDTKIELTKTEIIDVVDTKIESVKVEMNEKIESVKSEVTKIKTDLGTKITNLDTKMTNEFKKVNDRLDILEREAIKHG